MITFILIACGAILFVALIALAWGASTRRRAGQAGAARAADAVDAAHTGTGRPPIGRATGPD